MNAASSGLGAWVDRLTGARVGVIGDLVADIYIYGLTERISREAPVPVVRFENERLVPGCGANVAVNAAAVRAGVQVVGLVGQDAAGQGLAETLQAMGVHTDGLVFCPNRPTTSKTRLLAGARHTIRQQLVRLDREPTIPPEPPLRDALLERLRAIDAKVDAWVISDYGYHTFDERLKDALREVAARKPVLADSRFDTLGFSGMTVIKPNEEEAMQATSIGQGGIEPMTRAARILAERLGVRAVLVTLGNQGMLLHEQGRSPEHIPAVGTDQIVDLTGAGDTVAAIFTAALAAGAPMSDAAKLANCAASVVVMKEGAASTSPDELREVIFAVNDGD